MKNFIYFIIIFLNYNSFYYCYTYDYKKCCKCEKNDGETYEEFIKRQSKKEHEEFVRNYNKKQNITFKDLENLNKNIPESIISNNKERISEIVKVFKKDFTDEDINEILILLYNLFHNKNYNDIGKALYNKLSIDNDSMIYIVRSKVNKEDIFYIFHYTKKIYHFIKYLLFFDDMCILKKKKDSLTGLWTIDVDNGWGVEEGEEEFEGRWDVKVVNKVQKLLEKIFYQRNIKNGVNYPFELIYNISYFLSNYFEINGRNKNSKNYLFYEEINNLIKNGNIEINLEIDNLNLDKPIYIYVCNDTNECYLVKNEEQFKDLPNNIEQIIMKINSKKVEFFKY